MLLIKPLFIFLFCATLCYDSLSQASAPSAETILKPALAKAGSEGKNVLLIFHASWCTWCRKMDTSLHDASIKNAIDKNYEIVHLTVYESPDKKVLENPGALDFLKKNDGEDKGIPYWYVLNKNGEVLSDSQYKPGKNAGCPATEEEVTYFISVLRKTSSMTEEELNAVRKRFRQNE